MKLLFATVLCLVFCAPFALAQTLPVVELTGEKIASYRDGDLVRPRISPDGLRLAFSNVVVGPDGELCEIMVRDIATGRTRVVLNAVQSKRYAVYAAFVVDLKWESPTRLTAVVADGDVDSTTVTYNAVTGRLLRRSYLGPDDSSAVRPDLKFAVAKLRAIRPAVPKAAFEAALQDGNGAFAIGGSRIVFQYNYSGLGNDIQLANLTAKTVTPLIKLPDTVPAPKLIGGFAFGDSFYVIVDHNESASIYFAERGTAKLAAEVPLAGSTETNPSFEIKASAPERVVFALLPVSPATEMRATLWIADRSGLSSVELPEGTFDIDIRAGKAAFARYDGSKRGIEVFQYKPK